MLKSLLAMETSFTFLILLTFVILPALVHTTMGFLERELPLLALPLNLFHLQPGQTAIRGTTTSQDFSMEVLSLHLSRPAVLS
ncbi:MAG: hypothetical protein EB072_17350 [Betaproteobacteria bacterium]|nr:hypothetical protein [Betaproteobacteria bacterium]